jgi:hypothetical protein
MQRDTVFLWREELGGDNDVVSADAVHQLTSVIGREFIY